MTTSWLKKMGCAALLVPVLIFAVASTSWAAWRCQSDGIARDACCCPKAEAPADPVVASAQCCDLERTELERAPSELTRVQPLAAAPVLAALPLLEPPSPDRAAPASPALPAHAGRSLVLQKRSLLI